MRSILTPNTIYKNRNQLVRVLQDIYGNDTVDLDEHDNRRVEMHQKKKLDLYEKEDWMNKMRPSRSKFHLMMKIWIDRARVLIRIRSQTAGILEQVCQPFCIFCFRTWGLKCESINDIEVVFKNFLKLAQSEGRKYSERDWDVNEWQHYYRNNVVFRTHCYLCYRKILLSKQQSLISSPNSY